MWGRDARRFALDTRGGPSWKPLPVVVTTPLSLTGEPGAGAVAGRRPRRRAAGARRRLRARRRGSAGGSPASPRPRADGAEPWWLFNTALGNSEGLLAAAALWAVVAHLDGRHRAALALGTAAALLRPEVWPFLGLYGLWLWRAEPRRAARAGRRGRRGGAAAVARPGPARDGGALSASRAARGEPSLGSAALEDVPGLAVLADAVALLTVPRSRWPAIAARSLA